jgi:hypothetical protein
VIASTGAIDGNELGDSLRVVESATPECKRMVMLGHPMHPDSIPAGNCAFSLPVPPENEYFPPLSAEKLAEMDRRARAQN